jgi:hypothetical protein
MKVPVLLVKAIHEVNDELILDKHLFVSERVVSVISGEGR